MVLFHMVANFCYQLHILEKKSNKIVINFQTSKDQCVLLMPEEAGGSFPGGSNDPVWVVFSENCFIQLKSEDFTIRRER